MVPPRTFRELSGSFQASRAALARAEEIVARAPDHGRAWFEVACFSRTLSWMTADASAFGRALDAIDRAVRLVPDDRSAWSIRGGMLEALQRSFDDAHRACAYLRPLAQSRFADRSSLLEALLSNHERAAKLEAPGTRAHAAIFCRVARVMRALDRHEEALRIYEGLRVVDPTDRSYYELAIAHTLESMGRDDAALEAIARWSRASEERRATSTLVPPPRFTTITALSPSVAPVTVKDDRARRRG
jgi:tetratricopeptide (TPR) repeat protein